MHWAPGIPHALYGSEGQDVMQNPGAYGLRDREAVSGFDVIARSEATKQSILSFRGGNGLLRGACHRAALCADLLARNDGLAV